MVVSNQFKTIISEDIAKCEYEITQGSTDSNTDLHSRLISKYSKIIDGFDEHLRSLFCDDDGKNCKKNLETMQQKLELFQAMNYENIYSDNTGNALTINNANSVDVSVKVSFSDVRKQVEDMTALKEEEIQEILQKNDELEQIANSNERKTKKWKGLNGVLKWIADKSVDVGIALLPLVIEAVQKIPV